MPVDQSNTGPVIGLVSIDAKVAQTFTPSVSSVNSVQLSLSPLIQGLFEVATIAVNVRSGSITGPIIGTSNFVTVGADAPRTSSVVTFTFTPAVTVSPGSTYVFEVVSEGGVGNVIGIGFVNTPYIGGNVVIAGKTNTSLNFYFSHVGSGTGSPPNPATNLACIVAGATEIDLVWVNNGNLPTGFIIQRSTDNVTFSTLTTTGIVTTYADLTVAAMTRYYYRVIATNATGNAAPSNTANAITPGVVPNPATSLTGSIVGFTEIDLTWTNNGGSPTGFKIQRSTDGVTYSTVTTTGVVTSYNDTGLTSGQVYYYKVVATNGNGDAAASNVFSITTGSLLPYNDNFESYSQVALTSLSTWIQVDNSVGGHNTAAIVASGALDGTGSNALSQGNARLQYISVASVAAPAGVIFPADNITSCLVQPNAPSSVGTEGAGCFSRGSNLGSVTTASFYGAGAVYHGGLTLFKCISGVYTSLGSLTTPFNAGGTIYQTVILCQGTTVKAGLKIITGANAGMWLNSDGTIGASSKNVYAIVVTDSSIAGSGLCGVFNNANGGGNFYDDFSIVTAAADVTAPTCTLTAPTNGAGWSGNVTMTATASDNVQVDHVDFLVDGNVAGTSAYPGPYTATINAGRYPNGTHSVQAIAYDTSLNPGPSGTVSVTVSGSTLPTLPTLAHSMSWIDVAMGAYSGFPLPSGALDSGSNAILSYVNYVDAGTAAEPILRGDKASLNMTIYFNIQTVYNGLLIDILNYLDTNSISREAAFYHAKVATSFVGGGQSTASPWTLWQLFSLPTGGVNLINNNFTDNAPIWPSASGNYLYAGYPDRFRSLTTVGATASSGGWSAVLQYCNGVDVSGFANSWATLTTLSDTTTSLSVAGTIDWNPPADWIPCKVTGQLKGFPGASSYGSFNDGDKYKYYYVRWFVNGSGTAPTATGLRGADFTGQGSGASGTIPVYDSASDGGSKGWLTAAEYAGRAAGKDAHFAYQGRICSSYGQMRMPINVSNVNAQAWCSYFANLLISNNTDYDGISMDNSSGTSPVDPTKCIESVATYLADYALCLQTIWNNAGTSNGSHRWVLANTANDCLAGANNNAVTIASISPGVFHEGLMHPFGDSYIEFETKLAGIRAVHNACSPAPISMIDFAAYAYDTSGNPASYPCNGFSTQLVAQQSAVAVYNCLCNYYLMHDTHTFFSLWGINGVNDTWTNHWANCITANVGSPVDDTSAKVFDTGADSVNGALTYKVYKREFGNAIVLYRPRSYASSVWGTWGNGGVAKSLAGAIAGVNTYYQLDPSSGHTASGITSIALNNGQRAILFKSPQ